jgi:SOS response regulatory protein OraA/RecX
MEYMSKERFEEEAKIEKLRNKMLKYIVYKKRTEAEIKQKFSEEDENMVEDAIEYFKELNYIDDSVYVERVIKEFIALRNLSIKEIVYKICQKGVNKSLVDDYVCKNKETMLEYEISSAKNIIKKKQGQEEQEIKNFLYKKGFMSESVNIAFDELDDK